MPTYDYVCRDCGHRLEVTHGIHGHGPTTCPVCGGRMRKAVTAAAIHFKGSGWAKKDRSAARSDKASTKATAGGDEGSSGSSDQPASAADKPATRGESKGGGAEAGSKTADPGRKRAASPTAGGED